MYRSTEVFCFADVFELHVPKEVKIDKFGYSKRTLTKTIGPVWRTHRIIHSFEPEDGTVPLENVSFKAPDRALIFKKYSEERDLYCDTISVLSVEQEDAALQDLSHVSAVMHRLRRIMEGGGLQEAFLPAEIPRGSRSMQMLQMAMNCELDKKDKAVRQYVLKVGPMTEYKLMYRTVGQFLLVLDTIAKMATGRQLSMPITIFLKLLMSRQILNGKVRSRLLSVAHQNCGICILDTFVIPDKNGLLLLYNVNTGTEPDETRMVHGKYLSEKRLVTHSVKKEWGSIDCPILPHPPRSMLCGQGKHNFCYVSRSTGRNQLMFGAMKVNNVSEYNFLKLVFETLRGRLLTTNEQDQASCCPSVLNVDMLLGSVPKWAVEATRKVHDIVRSGVQVRPKAWKLIADASAVDLFYLVSSIPAECTRSSSFQVQVCSTGKLEIVLPSASASLVSEHVVEIQGFSAEMHTGEEIFGIDTVDTVELLGQVEDIAIDLAQVELRNPEMQWFGSLQPTFVSERRSEVELRDGPVEGLAREVLSRGKNSGTREMVFFR